MKAAKVVVARDLVIADLHGEKQPEREGLEMNVNVGKTVPISFKEVEEAYAVSHAMPMM